MSRPSLYAAGVVLSVLLAVPLSAKPRAVIFDTDICDDIDDTWALAALLQSPELDCKLITTAVGNTEAKAKVVAKFLERVARTEIPIGVGVKQHDGSHRQTAWAQEYDLSSYPGKVHKDGVQALIDTIMKSQTRITVIAVGPLPNIGEALKREPRIAARADFIGMHGSVYKGYGGSDTPHAEYNVKADVGAAKRTFTARWPMTITPLDTCGLVVVDGEKYQRLLKKESPLVKSLLENYRVWYENGLRGEKKFDEDEIRRRTDDKLNSSSSTLFDTVAIYLALTRELTEMERLPIRVTDDGFTRIDEGAKKIDCAVKWKDLDAYESWLVDRLTK